MWEHCCCSQDKLSLQLHFLVSLPLSFPAQHRSGDMFERADAAEQRCGELQRLLLQREMELHQAVVQASQQKEKCDSAMQDAAGMLQALAAMRSELTALAAKEQKQAEALATAQQQLHTALMERDRALMEADTAQQ